MQKIISICLMSVSLLGLQTIEVTQKQQDDLGIKTQSVSSVKSIDFGPYNGLVVLDKKDIISLNSKLESNVKEIYVRELEHVKKGQKLVTLTSNKLLSLQQDYLEAVLERESATQNYERNIKLHADGIISSKRLLESKKMKRSSDLQAELASRHLLTTGLSNSMLRTLKKSNKPVFSITLYAPRSGVVKSVNANIGEYISTEHKIMEIYADGDRFIEITLPVKNVKNISLGDAVRFESSSAEVTAIGNIVNTSSQSLLVRAKIKDSAKVMLNRVYEARIEKKVDGVYKIKKTALVFDESQPLVFRKTNDGFEVLEVSIIKEGPRCYIVRAPLSDTDQLAATSTSALLSAMDSEDE